MVFFENRKKKVSSDEIHLPQGDIYEPYHPLMTKWILETRKLPYENFYIKSHDGLTLRAKYFEFAPNAVTEIMFHGFHICHSTQHTKDSFWRTCKAERP